MDGSTSHSLPDRIDGSEVQVCPTCRRPVDENGPGDPGDPGVLVWLEHLGVWAWRATS